MIRGDSIAVLAHAGFAYATPFAAGSATYPFESIASTAGVWTVLNDHIGHWPGDIFVRSGAEKWRWILSVKAHLGASASDAAKFRFRLQDIDNDEKIASVKVAPTSGLGQVWHYQLTSARLDLLETGVETRIQLQYKLEDGFSAFWSFAQFWRQGLAR